MWWRRCWLTVCEGGGDCLRVVALHTWTPGLLQLLALLLFLIMVDVGAVVLWWCVNYRWCGPGAVGCGVRQLLPGPQLVGGSFRQALCWQGLRRSPGSLQRRGRCHELPIDWAGLALCSAVVFVCGFQWCFVWVNLCMGHASVTLSL